MKKNTGKRTFQPCVRDCRVKPTAFRRGLATESLTVPQERPKEKESPEHSSGGHPSRHINYNTDSDHPCQSPFRPGKQGVNQSSLCFHCHKDRHTGQHTHPSYLSISSNGMTGMGKGYTYIAYSGKFVRLPCTL